MKKQNLTRILVAMACLCLGCSSCGPEVPIIEKLFGHWGCETYVSCRTNSHGVERWDTLYYEVGEGHGYELWFWPNGTGKIRLNDSPALIKEFSYTYEIDEEKNQVVLCGSAWIWALYGSLYMDENEFRFDIDNLDDTELNVTWTNVVSENEPFFERFVLKKIE